MNGKGMHGLSVSKHYKHVASHRVHMLKKQENSKKDTGRGKNEKKEDQVEMKVQWKQGKKEYER